MTRWILVIGVFLLPLPVVQSTYASSLDLVLSHAQCHDFGGGEHSGTYTRGEVTATVGLAGSDYQPPTVRTEAWLWTFPKDTTLTDRIAEIPHEGVFQWNDAKIREGLEFQENPSANKCTEMEAQPGTLSGKGTLDGASCTVSFSAKVHRYDVLVRPTLEVESTEAGERVVRKILLPELRIPEKARRLVDLSDYNLPGVEGQRVFLELRPACIWPDKGSRVRRENYTGSRWDRVDLGGEVSVGAYSYHGIGD
jgi:hypothetical protein